MNENEKSEEVQAADAAIDPIEAKDAEIARLTEERDNYKTVALKRLGKLEGDAEFMGVDKDSGLTVEEQVKKTLLDREIAKVEAEKAAESKRLSRENAELRLALKNRPGQGIGSDSGSSGVEVKDNVFSEAQLSELRARAARLKADPEKFIETARKNVQSRR